MRLIDAFTGRQVRPGDTVPAPYPRPGPGEPAHAWTLMAVHDRFFKATAVVSTTWAGVQEVPLAVRFLHPSYPFQRVLFFPS